MGRKNLIKITGAREHNLKNVDLQLPANEFIVITGLSGSGKSSIAFDTLYAEGRRRYIESLSAYARQFLGQIKKPDVELIEGLSPAIAIEQRSLSHNPRSIVATQTEVYDYLRLLFARLGEVHCYKCNRPLSSQSSPDIVQTLLANEGQKIEILAPVIWGKKGAHKDILSELFKQGFIRVRIDGQRYELPDAPQLSKNKYHNIDVVIDRIITKPSAKQRLNESVDLALKIGSGKSFVIFHNGKETREEFFSEEMACHICGISYPEIEPRMFSFNSPYGACAKCHGLGVKFDIDIEKIIDFERSLSQGAIIPWRRGGRGYIMYYKRLLREFCFANDIDMDTPFNALSKQKQRLLLYGSDEPFYSGRIFEGIAPHLLRLFEETESEEFRREINTYMSKAPCPECKGSRLNKMALSVYINGKNIADICKMDIESAYKFLSGLKFSGQKSEIARVILRQAVEKLRFCLETGLGYITLDRLSSTLSGGEAQRIQLATQIGANLRGILYVLDEPTIGMHPADSEKLIKSLKKLKDIGNTLVVVEHDRDTIMSADFVVDMGPGAGEQGGEVVFAGPVSELMKSSTITGEFLSGKRTIPLPGNRRRPKNYITIKGAREHNLKNIDVKIPLGVLTCITGVSGSGKSTLIYDILYKALARKLYKAFEKPGKHKAIIGTGKISRAVMIDQSPIGRTPRSNPATYTGVFSHIRALFAKLPEAKIRGYAPGRFSFNVKGGRCEECQGAGIKKIEMHFLPDLYVPCEKCKGKRYNESTLEVLYKGHSIADILNMQVNQAVEVFKDVPNIMRILNILKDVGLGYIKLGQPATTLSGGEAQRMKLASELYERHTKGPTLYILDEPTTGLHFADEEKLLKVLHKLVDMGNSVVVIEHNMDVVKTADWVIDLGPEGGRDGGRVIASGPPEAIIKHKNSKTGHCLKGLLNMPVKN